MLTHTRIGLPVALETSKASSQLRCQVTRQGLFHCSAVAAGHICCSVVFGARFGGDPSFIASSDGGAPPEAGGRGGCCGGGCGAGSWASAGARPARASTNERTKAFGSCMERARGGMVLHANTRGVERSLARSQGPYRAFEARREQLGPGGPPATPRIRFLLRQDVAPAPEMPSAHRAASSP